MDGIIGKTTDGEDGTVDGYRVHHHVDAGAVRQSRIHYRRSFVHHPVALCHDLLYDGPQLFLRLEVLVPSEQTAVFFDEDVRDAVDHYLCDGAVGYQLLQDPQPTDFMKELSEQALLFG